MTREIKFRGKASNLVKDGKGRVITEYESWVYGDLLHLPNGVLHILTLNEEKGVYENYVINPNTVGQFIGLRDKNEKEIFEDDIVAWYDSDGNYRKDLVKWMNGGLCPCTLYTGWDYCEMEVIGNIYDNPELLKGDK